MKIKYLKIAESSISKGCIWGFFLFKGGSVGDKPVPNLFNGNYLQRGIIFKIAPQLCDINIKIP
jgi:hypothetical protein